jgi:cytochrome c
MADATPPPRKGRTVAIALVVLLVLAAAIAAIVLLRARPPVVTVDVSDQVAPEQPLAYYLARADAARGEAYFARCSACHAIEQGAPTAVGPNLWGVMGNPIGSRPDYAYSQAMSRHGGRWDWAAANAFLRSPRNFLPQTRMSFYGIVNPQDRADIMLYMNRQGGALPAPEGAR